MVETHAYLDVWQRIMDARHPALISHINPDADTLGSALALYCALLKLSRKASIVNYSKELPQNLDFLPHFDKIKSAVPQNSDLIVSFDCGSIDRLGIEKGEIPIINIDHHISNNLYGDMNIVEPKIASSTLVVLRLFEENGIAVGEQEASCIYTGLATDTGFFQYDNTDAVTFETASRLVSLGARPDIIAKNITQREPLRKLRLLNEILSTLELCCEGQVAFTYVTQEMFKKTGGTIPDTDDVANIGRTLATVETSLFLREEHDGRIKASMRSKNRVDVSEIAVFFGGGGHHKAAGITFSDKDMTIDQAKDKLLSKICEAIKDTL